VETKIAEVNVLKVRSPDAEGWCALLGCSRRRGRRPAINASGGAGPQDGSLVGPSVHARCSYRERLGGFPRTAARFSRPDSSWDSVISSAVETLTRFEKLRLDSPRSIVPMNVRWTPHASANDSCEYPRFRRSSRIRFPRAIRVSCTSPSLKVSERLRIQHYHRQCLHRVSLSLS